jgi:phosphoadenosine phosphosulfate reductase
VLIEKHIDGYVKDKVAMAIARLREFEPEEGYYLAFSGGKDSQCIYHLAIEAGVKFDAHYNITGIDNPELVEFIKTNYPDVSRDMYKKSMWKLIESNGPPMQNMRFCCKALKENGGEGRFCITGVRWAESSRRAANRNAFEFMGKTKAEKMLFNDNDEGRRQFEQCSLKGKFIVNPIIDWLDEDVWEYLNGRGIEHCKLYDEGWHRLGCIGCPMATPTNREMHFVKYPKFKGMYLRAFQRWLDKHPNHKEKYGWNNVDDVMKWWIWGSKKQKQLEGQIDIDEWLEDTD